MGLDISVRFPAGSVPAWDAVRGQLARVGESAPIRMIDGLPAFPDESPADDWCELRVAAEPGMITIRRSTDTITLVIWSNADAGLLAARDKIAWACAAAGSGTVITPNGTVSADEFARLSGISPA